MKFIGYFHFSHKPVGHSGNTIVGSFASQSGCAENKISKNVLKCELRFKLNHEFKLLYPEINALSSLFTDDI